MRPKIYSISYTIKLLFIPIILISISCTKDEPFPDNTGLSDYDLEVIDYFKDIALGFEFSNSTEVTRRWETDMQIFVGGDPSVELLEELDLIIEEINTLTNSASFHAEIVHDSIESNYYMFFGSGNSYGNLFPELRNLIAVSTGLFTIFWNSENQLYSGHMFVDMVRTTEEEQKHAFKRGAYAIPRTGQ